MENTRTIEKKEEKQPKTPKQMTLFVLKIVGNVVFYGVILLLFIYSLMNINAKRKHGIPNIFGKGYLVVLTDSMTANIDSLPEQYKEYKIKQFSPYIKATETTKAYKGDLVNVTLINGKNQKTINKLKVGDVITYWDDSIELSDGTKGAFNTHRITYVGKDENGNTIKLYTIGDKYVSLYADAIKNPDTMTESEIYDYETRSYLGIFGEPNFSSIKAVVTSVNYGGGYTVTWIQNHWVGIFIIPIAIILVVEIILVIKNILDLRREKNKKEDALTHEQQMAELQSEKERMRAELLAELRSQGVITEDTPAEQPVEAENTEDTVETKEELNSATEETKEEVAEEPKVEEAPVEEQTEEVKEETPVVEEEPQEETKSEENIEAVKETKGEENPVVEETKEAEASLNMELEENEVEKPAKKPAAKKTSTKKSTSKKTKEE